MWVESASKILEMPNTIIQEPQGADAERVFDLDSDNEEFKRSYNTTITDMKDQDADQEGDKEEPTIHMLRENDLYMNMEVAWDWDANGNHLRAIVKKRVTDGEGRVIDKPSENPLTDTRMYEFEYVDEHKDVISANIIAESILVP